MKRSLLSLLSLLLAMLMLLGVLASCGGTTPNETESASEGTERETATNTETSSENGSETVKETESAKVPADTEEETSAPSIEGIDNGLLIENAYNLANGVNAYFTDGKRTDFAMENQNVYVEYALANFKDQQISTIKSPTGKVYAENTGDVFVKMKNGYTFYASDSSKATSANLYRFGYYMYETRLEDQLFNGELIVEDSLTVDVKNIKRNQVKVTEGENGSALVELTNSDDPFIIFNGFTCSAEYKYIQIKMKVSTARMRSICFYLAAGSKTSIDGSQTKYFTVSPSDEYQTYTVSLADVKGYEGTLNILRLDFTGDKRDVFDIAEIKLIKGENGDPPANLELARSFYMYSDKLHHVLQVATREVATENIDRIGMETKIAADTVSALIVKDKNGTHTSLADVDWNSAEYVGFDVKGAGIFGYILPADASDDKLEVVLADGYYTIIQSRAPEGGTILPSGKKNESTGKIDPIVPLNGNDFFMGQRLYTDANHTFDAFLKEAEAERHPLGASNFVIDENASANGKFSKYDTMRGIYVLTLDSTGFNGPFFMYPNKHYNVRFTVKGDNTDRSIYVMTASSSGNLECAVLLDENDMMLPVPIEVGKNFSEASGERCLFNIEDALYNEAIIPMVIKAGSKDTYNFLNLYQNWGQYPLKQVSWIQFYAPYYHLSTGVTETNCIVPYYSCKNSRGLGTLPDHRAMSAPYWAGQPQHNSGGSHTWLIYTDAEGIYSASENTLDTIDSYGPIYADVYMDYISDDGNIKVSYVHTEFPQTDENRAYYEMKYEIIGDVTFANFAEDFQFYQVGSNDPTGKYQSVGYLNTQNESVIVNAAEGDAKNKYVLGDKCPYFSFFNMKNYTSESAEGYTNLSFLVYNSEFIIDGKKAEPSFVIINENDHVRLSLDLGEVTLKAGDSFTINCIVMPWGSQESVYDSKEFAGDQNVRDVRTNTLLNPLTPTAKENCQVIESVFVPKLKTTDGKSATFTLTGGHNNVAVRIYGFEKLTAPVIEELVDGKWVTYNVSSAYAPDVQGNGHYYDGYSVYYDGDGTFSYAFIAEMDYTDKDGRTFRITASEDFKPWPDELPEIEGNEKELPLDVYVSAEELSKNAGMSGQFGGVENNVSGNYVRLVSKAGRPEAYFTAYPGGTVATGQYFVLKYRIPEGNPDKIGSFEIFTSTTDSSPSYAGCYNAGSYLRADGQWHVLILDLASYGKATFAPSADGTYKVNYIRLDPFNDNLPEGNRFDMGFIGMSDNLEDIYKLALDLSAVDLVRYANGKASLSSIDPATGKPAEAETEAETEEVESETVPPEDEETPEDEKPSSATVFNVYLNATSIIKATQANGTGHMGDEELIENSNVARIHYCTVGDPTAPRRLESYFYLHQSATGGETGQYFVIKYRAPEQIGYMQIYAGTESTSAGSGGSLSFGGPTHATKPIYIGDGEWHVVVIDLSKAMSGYLADANGNYTAQHLRLDLFNLDKALDDGKTTYVDIAYAGLCDDYTKLIGYETDVDTILFYDGSTTTEIPTK